MIKVKPQPLYLEKSLCIAKQPQVDQICEQNVQRSQDQDQERDLSKFPHPATSESPFTDPIQMWLGTGDHIYN